MHTVTKSYRDLPAAHRQHNHPGHCSLIHGHNWGFDVVFTCDELDPCGFVIDVGNLKALKEWLGRTFDHTLLLNMDDPFLETLQTALDPEDETVMANPAVVRFANTVVVPNCGMEGLAKLVWFHTSELIEAGAIGGADRGLRVLRVTCWEDSKNRADFFPTP